LAHQLAMIHDRYIGANEPSIAIHCCFKSSRKVRFRDTFGIPSSSAGGGHTSSRGSRRNKRLDCAVHRASPGGYDQQLSTRPRTTGSDALILTPSCA
jgi:hypothetical protein